MTTKFERGIDDLAVELIQIAKLRKTVETDGWVEVLAVFQHVIGEHHQYIFDNSGKVTKFFQVVYHKMLVESLGKILSSLDSRVKSEEFIKQKLIERGRVAQQIKAKKELQQLY